MAMKPRAISLMAVAIGLTVLSCVGWTQQGPATTMPKTASVENQATAGDSDFDHSRILMLHGELKDRTRKQLTGIVGILFAIYEQQEGGAPLWQEVQNIQVDKREHFTAMVGSETPGGISPELFSRGKPCWLGMLVMQPGQLERPRMRLVRTPAGLTVQRGVSQMIAQEGSGETVGSQPDQNGSPDRPSKTRRKLHRPANP
jgi:hypothetical protein